MFQLPSKATIRADIGLLLTFLIGVSGDFGFRPLTPTHADQIANLLTVLVYGLFTVIPPAIQAWREVQHAALAAPLFPDDTAPAPAPVVATPAATVSAPAPVSAQ